MTNTTRRKILWFVTDLIGALSLFGAGYMFLMIAWAMSVPLDY
jgi:hypothetical protein